LEGQNVVNLQSRINTHKGDDLKLNSHRALQINAKRKEKAMRILAL